MPQTPTKSPEVTAKEKLLKRLQGDKPEAAPAPGMQINLTGLPALDEVIAALSGMAAAIAQQQQQLDVQRKALDTISSLLNEQIALQKSTNDLLIAPVVPERDAEGRIISAHRKLTNKTEKKDGEGTN